MPSHRFTPEQARAAGLKSVALRAERKRNAIELASRPPAPELLDSAALFQTELLTRVRAQALSTLRRYEEENAKPGKVDGMHLDRLASALERLAELERVLDGRPSPGTRRPAPEPSNQARPAPPTFAPPRPATPPSSPPTGSNQAAASSVTPAPAPPLRLADPPDL